MYRAKIKEMTCSLWIWIFQRSDVICRNSGYPGFSIWDASKQPANKSEIDDESTNPYKHLISN